MTEGIFDVLQAVRGILLEHLANSQPLLVDLPAGSTVAAVPNTSRFRVGDTIFLTDPRDSTHLTAANTREALWIVEIPEYNQLVISTVDPESAAYSGPVGSAKTWTVSGNSQVLKTIRHRPLMRAHIGDLRVIQDFPTITVSPTDESNEWLVFRGTSHEHKMAIRAYVLADNFEESEKVLSALASQVREVLFDHAQMPVSSFPAALVADLPTGGRVVEVADTSRFFPGAFVFLRDAKKRPHGSQIAYVRGVLSATELELSCSVENDYLVARGAEIVLARRYLYDTRPSSISYGYVPGQGGSFMRAAEISFFGKEMILRDPPVLLT